MLACEQYLTHLRKMGVDASVLAVDELIAGLAARQRRVVTAAQLIELGVSEGEIAGRVDRKLLLRLHTGVFVWGGPPVSFDSRALAAVLACPSGVISHQTAGVLSSLCPWCEGPIHMTFPRGGRLRQAGIRPHESLRLADVDVSELDGLPVTTPARTIVDLAAVLTERELADALDRAQIKRLVTKGAVLAAIERAGVRRPGVTALRRLIDEPTFSRSDGERELRKLLRAAELPIPAFNVYANGFEVDAIWRTERVILELDSYTFHMTRAAFERDRRRDAAHTRAGFITLRATWREVTQRPHAFIARVAEALDRARRRAA